LRWPGPLRNQQQLRLQSLVLRKSRVRPPVSLRSKLRQIGPFRGGRVDAVEGVPGEPLVYYFGGTGGGVFKTTDGGHVWSPITDGQINFGSIGSIAVADSDHNVIYVGTGESAIRGNASHGDGVYKSLDAGKTWTHVGPRGH